MDDKWYPSLLLLGFKALDKALEKGFALSVAAVKRDNKYHYAYHVSDWDCRCDACLKDNDAKAEGA